jgi:hypothetical protein
MTSRLAHSAVVLVERDVQHPVQVVLDRPVLAHRRRELLGVVFPL